MAGSGTYFADLRDEVVDLLTSGISVDLRGQAGAGRSTLVAAATSGLVEQGWDVVHVRGVAALRERPLEALALADLVRRGDQRSSETLVTTSVARLQRALADGRTVLTVDDADDLDEASVGVIEGAHAQTPFPVLTTTRPRPRHRESAVTLAAEIRPGVQLELPPLTFVEVLAILADVLPGQIEPETLARINSLSGGLPSLIMAVGDGARRTGRIRRVDGVWVAGSDLWSPGLARMIQALVADLDGAALEALQMLSLAGAVSVSTATELVGWSALEDLDACGLLRFTPRGDDVVLAVYPPLVEERYRRLPLGARRLHFDSRMTRVLDPDHDHADAPSLLPRPVTTPWFWPRGETEPSATSTADNPRRVAGSNEVADTVRARLIREEWHRQYLVRRREWENDPTPPTAIPYLRALLILNTEPRVMLDVVERTAPGSNPAHRASLYRWHALVLAFAADDLEGARTLLEHAAGEVGPWASPLLAVEDYLVLAFDRIPTPRPVEELEATHQFAAGVEAASALSTGHVDTTLAVLSTTEWTDADMITTSEVLQGLAHLMHGDVDRALTWSTEHLEAARDALDPEGIPGHAFVAVSALLMRGRTHDTRALLGSVLSIGLASSIQRHYTASLLELAAALAARDGLTSPAATFSEQARTTGSRASALAFPTWTWGFTRLDPSAPSSDREESERLWALASDNLDRGFIVTAAMLGGSAVELVPDPERAAALREIAESTSAGLIEATAQVAEAAVDPDPAAGVLLSRRLIDQGLVALGIRALGQSVHRLRADGRGVEATAMVEEVRRQLRRRGIDPGPVLRGMSPSRQLTPREQEVGTLVAGGMSNSEIARRLSITPKTVENHLNRLMRKLDVTDRAALVARFRG